MKIVQKIKQSVNGSVLKTQVFLQFTVSITYSYSDVQRSPGFNPIAKFT